MATTEPPWAISFAIYSDTITLTLPRPEGVLMPSPISPYSHTWWLPNCSKDAHSLMVLGLVALCKSRLSHPARHRLTCTCPSAQSRLLHHSSRQGMNPGPPPHGFRGTEKMSDAEDFGRQSTSPTCQHLVSKWKRARAIATEIQNHYCLNPRRSPPMCACSCFAPAHSDGWGRRVTQGVAMTLEGHSGPSSTNRS